MATGESTPSTDLATIEEFDAIVTGAGVSDLYQLYRLRETALARPAKLAETAAKGYGGFELR